MKIAGEQTLFAIFLHSCRRLLFTFHKQIIGIWIVCTSCDILTRHAPITAPPISTALRSFLFHYLLESPEPHFESVSIIAMANKGGTSCWIEWEKYLKKCMNNIGAFL